MPTMPVAPGITRFEFEDRKGYMVRIRRNGQQTNEYFSDSRHGGKRKALVAAKERYAALCEELGPVQNATRDLLTHRNTTGKVGVHIAYSADRRWPGCEYYAYCASWRTDDGIRHKINFAWNKYGKEESFELACLARDEMIADRKQVEALYEKKKLKEERSAKRKATKKSNAKASATKKPVRAKPKAK
jgi:hypothetical protein